MPETRMNLEACLSCRVGREKKGSSEDGTPLSRMSFSLGEGFHPGLWLLSNNDGDINTHSESTACLNQSHP